jgi:MFS family permease
LNNRAEIGQNAADSQRFGRGRPCLSVTFGCFGLQRPPRGSAIRNVSNLYQVYQLSGSAFMLGLTGFLETLPFIIFGLFAGAVADAFDRKKVLLVTGLQLFRASRWPF